MPTQRACAAACLLIVGLAFGPSAASASGTPACMAAHRAWVSPHCRSVFAARQFHGREARGHRSHTGWRPVIPPFDQAEAEVEVHQIAPYRTYPYYPLLPGLAPYPDTW